MDFYIFVTTRKREDHLQQYVQSDVIFVGRAGEKYFIFYETNSVCPEQKAFDFLMTH